MTRTAPLDLDTCSFTELESHYQELYPHFNPYVWAAMAYFKKGVGHEECKAILDERFRDYNNDIEERARATLEYLEEQRRIAAESEGIEEIRPPSYWKEE